MDAGAARPRSPTGETAFELDVVIHHEFDNQLHHLTHMIKPVFARPQAPAAVRMRPERNIFEMEFPIPGQEHFDSRAEGDPRMKRMRHRAQEMPMEGQHMIGVLDGRCLHLHPLASVQQVRPDMSYVDEALSGVNSSDGLDGGASSALPSAAHKATASFKRSDERANAARKSSYNYLKQHEEAIPWQPLSVISNPQVSPSCRSRFLLLSLAVSSLHLSSLILSFLYLTCAVRIEARG